MFLASAFECALNDEKPKIQTKKNRLKIIDCVIKPSVFVWMCLSASNQIYTYIL